MADCILGIKCNGVSMKIDSLEIDANQAAYDYICNVMLAVESNGNGRYDISIVDKDFIQGFSIGEWRITKAWIIFNWGSQKQNTLCLIKTEILLMRLSHQDKKEVSVVSLQSLSLNRYFHLRKKWFAISLLPQFVTV